MNEAPPENGRTHAAHTAASPPRDAPTNEATGGAQAGPAGTAVPGAKPRAFSWWWLFFLLFTCGVGAYVWYILAPSFWSPRSRVYASLLGYPAVMRYLGKPIALTAVDRVATRRMVHIVSAEGSLGYLNEIPIHSEVPGIVTKVLVEPGQEVRRGDLLMQIDGGGHMRRLDQLAVEVARWDVIIAKAALVRAGKMLASRSISIADYEQFVLAHKHAEATFALADEKFRYALVSRSKAVTAGLPKVQEHPQLTAPERNDEGLSVRGGSVSDGTTAHVPDASGSDGKSFLPPALSTSDIVATASGTVFRRSAQLGQNLTTADAPLVVIGDRLTFLAMFDQRYASALKVGDKGKYYLKAYPGKAYDGEVLRIAHYIEPENQKKAPQMSAWVQKQPPDTFDVWISIPAEAFQHQKFMTGMNGYVIFERPFTALAIPESALLRYSGRSGTVLTVDAQDLIEVKTVTYSTVVDGWVAIDSGLREGERIVLEGQLGLKPGDRVILPEHQGSELVAGKSTADSRQVRSSRGK
jgi:multidrug efflux pump subunit AcrA (membrane-fusion protein)